MSKPSFGLKIVNHALIRKVRSEHRLHVFGGADIFNLDFGAPIARAEMLAAVLTGLVDEKRRQMVRRFVVVAPPGSDQAGAVEDALVQFADSFEVMAKRVLQVDEAEALKARFDVVVAADRRHGSVLEAAQSEQVAVIVTEAASYRDDKIEPYVAPGATTPLQPEDVWAPQLHALASAATKLAGERMLYVALDSCSRLGFMVQAPLFSYSTYKT